MAFSNGLVRTSIIEKLIIEQRLEEGVKPGPASPHIYLALEGEKDAVSSKT